MLFFNCFFFFWKKYDLMHFEKHFAFQNALNYIFSKNTEKIPCFTSKGLGSRRGEIGPAIEMHNGLKYVYMVYFIEKNRNFICLVLKL